MPQEAAAKARAEGVTDRTELSATGTRAGLRGTRLRKDLAALFFPANGPPGFGAIRRDHRGVWDRQSDVILEETIEYVTRLVGAGPVKQRTAGLATPEAATDATGTAL